MLRSLISRVIEFRFLVVVIAAAEGAGPDGSGLHDPGAGFQTEAPDAMNQGARRSRPRRCAGALWGWIHTGSRA